mmetsp:Transcript_25279/g.66352  ORF Transcript_25279/g.66352 Transcript_25279/m.66352 type:complete len:82 (-) Transcript_25279:109-354(-)
MAAAVSMMAAPSMRRTVTLKKAQKITRTLAAKKEVLVVMTVMGRLRPEMAKSRCKQFHFRAKRSEFVGLRSRYRYIDCFQY